MKKRTSWAAHKHLTVIAPIYKPRAFVPTVFTVGPGSSIVRKK